MLRALVIFCAFAVTASDRAQELVAQVGPTVQRYLTGEVALPG